MNLIYSLLNTASLTVYCIAYYKKRTKYIPVGFSFVALRAVLRMFDFESSYEWYTATDYFRVNI